ncbi:MAG: hypothetical protein NVV63_02815 [Opitutus sp.]|nr:hypothetical protein [Opitutus sp.]
MEKRVLGVTDVDEGGLQAGIEILDAALVDAADHAVVGLALDLELLEAAVDEQRDALLERLGVDDEFAIGTLLLLEHGENLLEEGSLLGALGGARFQFRGSEGSGFRGAGRVDEFLVILLRDVLRDAGVGLRLIAHCGCRVG